MQLRYNRDMGIINPRQFKSGIINSGLTGVIQKESGRELGYAMTAVLYANG